MLLRINSKRAIFLQADEGYPRDVGNWWLGCPDAAQMEHFDHLGNDINTRNGNRPTGNSGNLQNEANSKGGDQFLAVIDPPRDVNNANVVGLNSAGILLLATFWVLLHHSGCS